MGHVNEQEESSNEDGRENELMGVMLFNMSVLSYTP